MFGGIHAGPVTILKIAVFSTTRLDQVTPTRVETPAEGPNVHA